MPAKKHDFTQTEIKAGFLVLFSGVLLALFVAAVMGLRPTAETKELYAYFTDIGGLNRGADVRFGGVLVGRVKAIEPAPDQQSLIRTTVHVAADTPVNEASTAFITQVTLTAAKHLEISTGADDAPLLPDKSDIPIGSGGLFGQLEAIGGGVTGLLSDLRELVGIHNAEGERVDDADLQTVTELLSSVKDLMGDVRLLMGVNDPDGEPVMTEEERKSLSEIFVSVDEAVQGGGDVVEDLRTTLSDNREDLDGILDNIQEITTNANTLVGDLNDTLADNRPHIDAAFEDLSGIMDTVAEIVNELGGRMDGIADSLETTLNNVEHLTGDARYLLENNTPAIEDMILDMREMVRNLKEFSRVMAEQPDAFIRGKRPSGR